MVFTGDNQVAKKRNKARRKFVWSLPDDPPKAIRDKARRLRKADARHARYGKLEGMLGDIPVPGDTLFAPMRNLLKLKIKTHEATRDGVDTEKLKEVGESVKDIIKETKSGNQFNKK